MPDILGPDGRPLRKADLTRPIATATGVWGVRPTVPGLRTDLDLTPEELAAMLREADWGHPEAYLELAQQMEMRDLHYRGVLGTRKSAVVGAEWHIDPAGDEAEGEKDAEFVEAALKDLAVQGPDPDGTAHEDGAGWGDGVRDMLDALGKGFSVTEIGWDTSEREWRPVLSWRDPRWFVPVVGTRGFALRGETENVPLRHYRHRFIVHAPRLISGLPLQGGLARAAAWAYCYAHFGLTDWLTFIELFGQPLRLGKYDPLATAGRQDGRQDDLDILEQAVRNLGSDASAVIPKDMTIEFVHGQARASADLYEKLLRYLHERVSIAVLGQTLTTETGGQGSYAASKTHNEVRYDIQVDDANQLAATLNRDLIPALVSLNRGPRKRYPRLRYQIDEPEDLEALSQQLERLVPLMPEGERPPVSWVRRKWGMPKGEDDEPQLAPSAPAGAPSDDNPNDAATPPLFGAPAARQALPAPSAPDLAAQLAQIGQLLTALQGQLGAGVSVAASGWSSSGQIGGSSDQQPIDQPGGAEALPAASTGAGCACCGGSAHSQAPAGWVDTVADELAADWRPVLGPVLSPVLAAAEQAGSYEAFAAALPGLLGRMDTGPLVERLAMGNLAARAKGDVDDEP